MPEDMNFTVFFQKNFNIWTKCYTKVKVWLIMQMVHFSRFIVKSLVPMFKASRISQNYARQPILESYRILQDLQDISWHPCGIVSLRLTVTSTSKDYWPHINWPHNWPNPVVGTSVNKLLLNVG